MNKMKATGIAWRELIFQIVLHLLVFIFYSFDQDHPHLEFHHVVFFLNYAVATLFISYFFLPRYYYRKKYLQFFLGLVLTIVVVIVVEEFVLEQIYFPHSRGMKFLGVFHSLIDVLPVMTILSGFKFAWDALRKQREVEVLRATVRESELQYLKSQINPHFLFNNLNNLYSYAMENSPKTPTIILELSSVLRYMLYECREEFVPLSKEIAQLENFTRLNQLQIEERGQVHFHRPNILHSYQIAPLILPVFVENAFKHSQASQTENILIDVEITLSPEGRLDFRCRNTFHSETNTDNLAHGIGLENVKKRLELIYPNAHQLDINESGQEFEVRLTMELSSAKAKTTTHHELHHH